jgi:PAS domain S-box-containing protein
MKVSMRFQKTRALIWFLVALTLFLALGTVLTISRQRTQLLAAENTHMDRELNLLGTIVSDDLLKHDYDAVRHYVTAFGSMYPDIYQIKIVSSNGYVLADQRRGQATTHPLKRTYCAIYGPRQCAVIELTHDLEPVQKSLVAMTFNSIAASLVFAGSMGSLLWYVLRKTAFVPLEKALAELHHANERLELRVVERTSEWMRANTDLKSEILEREAAERELLESESKFRSFAEQAIVGIYLIQDGLIKYCNPRFAEMFGHPPEAFSAGADFRSFIHPDDLPALADRLAKRLRNEIPSSHYRFRGIKKNGEVIFVEVYGTTIQYEGMPAAIGAVLDVTDKTLAENALRNALERAEEEKNKSAAIIAAIGDGISIQGTDYRILYQNDIHKKMIGDHVGEYCYRAYQQRDGICEGCAVVLSFADGKTHTTERSAVTDNGMAHVETIASPLRDAAGEIVAGIEVVRNITDRKKAEAERERLIQKTQDALETASRSRLEWQETFDSITDMIAIHDGDGRIIKANRAFARQFNLTPKDVINRNCHEFLRGGDPLITECPHKRTLDTSGPVTEEIADPVSGRIFLVSTFPYASSGAPTGGVIHITRDITESKEKEMRLIMSERLAALGQMASGIAHEINNPLASIAGCVDGLGRRVSRGQFEPDLFNKYLGIIKTEIERSKSITTSMLSIVRKNSYEKRKVNVHETIEKTLEIIGYQGRLKRIEVQKAFSPGTHAVLGSEGEFRQVLLIIVTNALDAMGDRGVLGLETAVEDGMLSIAVSDTGPGIAPENLTRVFDPFFTTKSDQGGTGLGLSIANRIIAAHRGTIRVLTESKSGTTFKISLPL